MEIEVKVAGVSDEFQLFETIKFKEKKTGQINSGPYASEFDRFVPRLVNENQ